MSRTCRHNSESVQGRRAPRGRGHDACIWKAGSKQAAQRQLWARSAAVEALCDAMRKNPQ